jgi:hypothetical protein
MAESSAPSSAPALALEQSVRAGTAARARDRRTAFGKRLIEEDRPLRVAYADPPYIGVAHRYPEQQEVDHVALIARLEADFPDGWALSAAQNSLRELLPMCPPGVRVGAWVKPFWGYKPGVSPGYAWEPVIYVGGRRRARMDMSGVKDWLSSNPSMGGTHGAHTAPAYKVLGQKPEAFCRWIFDLLNVTPDRDELIDLYPGSGAVLRAWSNYQTILPKAAAQA